ncbi:hypothetical protein MK280_12390, partial [Myxococcota bacterium]|nr:hypothetical protein [Myxococcota bacterium]
MPAVKAWGIGGTVVGLVALLLGVGGAVCAAEQGISPALHSEFDEASDFAPIGVLLDRTHQKGDWTFLYRYRQINRQGLQEGDQPVSDQQVAARYAEVPVSFIGRTHTLGALYAPLERLTLGLFLPIEQRNLQVLEGGALEETETIGIGDAKVVFLIPFIQNGLQKTQLNFGFSFPTGSIQQKNASTGRRDPYILQLGSGSWDAVWGITYSGSYRNLSWGGQFEGLYRINDNAVGYRLGTVYQASAWFAGGFGRWFSASGRFAWTKRGNLAGADPELDRALSPLNDPYMQGGTTLEVGPGLNVLLPILGGQRFSVEALFPVYQYLDGPQLAYDYSISVGWQWIF